VPGPAGVPPRDNLGGWTDRLGGMSESVEPQPAPEDPVLAGAEGAEAPEHEWWDDPGMPWRHKPGRRDLACMAWIGVITVWGLVMIPMRGWLLGHSVPVLVALTGSRSAVAGLGSLVRVGEFHAWFWPMLAGLIMSIKFDWVYWWAGKLWGRGMIEVWAGQSARAARSYARAERWAIRWGVLGMFIAYVPIPLPIMAVVFVLAGASNMKLRTFIALDAASCTVWLALYFLLGFVVGQPIVSALQVYARVANYVAIGLVAIVVVMVFTRQAKARTTAA